MAFALFLMSLASLASASASATQQSTVVEASSGTSCKWGNEECSTEEAASVSLLQSDMKLGQQLAQDKQDADGHTTVTSAIVQSQSSPISSVSLLSGPVRGLKRFAECYDAGIDVQSRDAACEGKLKCARAGYDGRGFGDCKGHCCSMEAYNSKLGRVGCPTDAVLGSGAGYTDEASVQAKCTEVQCAFYAWDSQNSGAWFCQTDIYDTVDNGATWPTWKVGRPSTEKAPGKRYTRCWDLGSDMQSRDAACEGELKCSRAGKDGRNFGDCHNGHCCSEVDQKTLNEETIKIAADDAKRAVEDAVRDKANGYDSKVGRGGCKDEDLFENGPGYPDESAVQDKCTQLKCDSYSWNREDGSAWFCKTDPYESVTNAAEWPSWKVGRPDQARRWALSKWMTLKLEAEGVSK